MNEYGAKHGKLKTKTRKSVASSGEDGLDLWEKWGASYADKNKEGVYEFI